MCINVVKDPVEASLTSECKVMALVSPQLRVREAIVVTGSHGGAEGEPYSKRLFMIGYTCCYATHYCPRMHAFIVRSLVLHLFMHVYIALISQMIKHNLKDTWISFLRCPQHDEVSTA